MAVHHCLQPFDELCDVAAMQVERYIPNRGNVRTQQLAVVALLESSYHGLEAALIDEVTHYSEKET